MEYNIKHINRFYLKSHFLLNNEEQNNVVKVVSECCGLNAQTARAPYISLWSRIKGFEKELLTKALYKDRQLVKTWLMRGTVHIVPVKDFSFYQKALRRNLVEGWHHTLQKHGLGLSLQKKTRLHKRIIDVLEEASLTKRELLPMVNYLLTGYSGKEQKIILSCTLRELSYQGFLCHSEPAGSWYHFRENRFTKVEHWLQGIDLNKIDETEAKRELILKYLHSYGPASMQDFAYWSGFKVTDSKRIFEDIKQKLIEVQIMDLKGSFWILKKDLAVLDGISIKKRPPVRFLPEFDSLIMGHKNKSRILNDNYRKNVFLPLADVAPTILFNGRVIGTWNFKITNKSFTVSPFEPLKSNEQKEIELESARLKQFLESKT